MQKLGSKEPEVETMQFACPLITPESETDLPKIIKIFLGRL